MNTTYDVLNLMLTLAADAGTHIDPDDLFDTSREAGTVTSPSRDYTDTTAWAAAACDLVLKEAALAPMYASRGLTPYEIVYRFRMCAYVASKIMPDTLVDAFDRYTLNIDEDGDYPCAEQVEYALTAALSALGGYVTERDSGEWIDPNVLSGAVADVHDAARMIIATHEMNGTATVSCRCDEDCQ